MLGAREPDKILSHGWILNKGSKMSKSKGNVLDPFFLIEKYPVEAMKIYFISKINFLSDGILNEEIFNEFYNNFFVNNLGNLVQRTFKMIKIYSGGIIPNFDDKIYNEELEYSRISSFYFDFNSRMDDFQLTKAFSIVENLIISSNKLISSMEP
jgi:methionyl-tRNA synthetase